MNVEVEIKILDNAFRKRPSLRFEKFYRSEKSRSSHTGGKGIGLAISKSIAQLHQGDITVRSNDKETVLL